MTRVEIGTLALVAMSVAMAYGGSMAFREGGPLVQDEETLAWLDDYDEAIAVAKGTGRPLFLEFRCAP